MPHWDLQHMRWFHAVNTPALLAEAIAVIDECAAQPPPAHGGGIPVLGIEADIRLSPPGALSTRQPVMHHDPFPASHTTVDGGAAPPSTVVACFTLWDFFLQLTRTSAWFKQRKEARAAATAPSPSLSPPSPPCRVVVKLDFKDPRAAGIFAEHVATWPAHTESAFVELCEGLAAHPQGAIEAELMVWWNADVCPSDSLLLRVGEGAIPPPAEGGVGDINQCFGDLPTHAVVAAVSRAVTSFPRDMAQHVLGLSLGWVLAPPPPPSSSAGAMDGGSTSLLDRYYTAADGERMERFLAALATALAARPNGPSVPVPRLRLLTFPVLYEAIFPSPEMSGCASDSRGPPPARTAALAVDNIVAIGALQRLLTCSTQLFFPASLSPMLTVDDGEACFITLWKHDRARAGSEAATRNFLRAAAALPSCTVDGEV